MITRNSVVQSYLDLFVDPSYLEIGVFQGGTFHNVTAPRKVAVDPNFDFGVSSRETGSEYHEHPSDTYFKFVRPNPFDVIYLDGLHTFEQTLRDLMNAIDVLSRDGVIIIDDVLPNSYHSSLPNHDETVAVRDFVNAGDEHSWMGDTYKLVFFIQSFIPLFDYATVSDNHGQLVMWRGQRSEGLFHPRLVEDIARMEFRHLVTQIQSFNLQSNSVIVDRVLSSRKRN